METKTYGRFENTGLVINYTNNVSNDPGNAANTVTAAAATPTELPLTGDGGNNFENRTVTQNQGRCQHDATFNSGMGGIITDRLKVDTEFFSRTTIVNTGGNSTFLLQDFLAFDKAIPGTGVAINSSQLTLNQNEEAAHVSKYFGNGIGAIYPRVVAVNTRDVRINGWEITASENQ